MATIQPNRARMRLENIVGCTGGQLRGENIEITGVTSDTRAIEPGNLFVALRGEKFDGHNFLEQAKERGAVAAVVETQTDVLPSVQVEDSLVALGDIAHWYRFKVRLSLDMTSGAAWWQFPLVAVTGSYGKTSTRSLIYAALSQKFNTLTSQANFNNEIGLPMTLLQMDESHEAIVLEMGMRGRGQIDYLAGIAEPSIGVITNVGPQHVELLGSVEEVAAAKAELLPHLPQEGLAVLPADSPFINFLKSKTQARIVTFGTAQGADYHATKIRTREDGNTSCEINGVPIDLPIPGAHNAVNAAAAFAVGHELGVKPEDIQVGLQGAELPGARMRILKLDNGITVIDDCYNAGPDSMRASLQTLLDFPGTGRRVAILGAMRELGPFSEQEHVKVGRFAGQFAELLVGVAGDTRPLLNAAVAAAREVENEMEVHYSDDAAGAAERVGEWLRSGDVVLVKGSRSIGLEAVVDAVKGL